MKYRETIDQVEKLLSEGTLTGQNVEVIMQNKKYFIGHIDFKADRVTLQVDRSHFKLLTPDQFLNQLKEVRDMVNPDAEFSVAEESKPSDTKEVTSLYCNNNFLEVLVES